MVGVLADRHQRAARFASRMSNERSADELHPRKMERVDPDSESGSSQPWQGRILQLNHTARNGVPSRTLTSNLEFRTLPLCALSYGDGERTRATRPSLSVRLIGPASITSGSEECSLLLLV